MARRAFLMFDTNAEDFAAELAKVAETLKGAPYGPASAAFKDIRDLLIQDVRSVMTAQSFVPNTEVTKEVKARMGLDSRVLFASGNTFADLDGASGATWAKAMRGSNEWYIFLHNEGKGTANWTRDDRAMAADPHGARRHRKSTARPGMRVFPKRQAFYITDSARGSILNRLELFYQTLVDEVGQ